MIKYKKSSKNEKLNLRQMTRIKSIWKSLNEKNRRERKRKKKQKMAAFFGRNIKKNNKNYEVAAEIFPVENERRKKKPDVWSFILILGSGLDWV